MQRKGRHRLTIDIPTPIFEQLKIIAQRRNLTYTRYIIRLLIQAMKQERELE